MLGHDLCSPASPARPYAFTLISAFSSTTEDLVLVRIRVRLLKVDQWLQMHIAPEDVSLEEPWHLLQAMCCLFACWDGEDSVELLERASLRLRHYYMQLLELDLFQRTWEPLTGQDSKPSNDVPRGIPAKRALRLESNQQRGPGYRQDEVEELCTQSARDPHMPEGR